MATSQANWALTAAGYRLSNGTPSDAGGFTLTVAHGDTTHTTDTARMTLGNIGQWLFCAEVSAADAHTLVGSTTARAVLLGMGYVQNEPDWWSPESTRNTPLARLYCERGIWMTVVHLRGTMFDRSRGLESMHIGSLTRGQLLALISHSYEWVDRYLDDENVTVPTSHRAELDSTRFCLNPSPYGPRGPGAPDDLDNTSASSSSISSPNHVERRRCAPNYYHNDTALTTAPRKRRRQRGRSPPPSPCQLRATQ